MTDKLLIASIFLCFVGLCCSGSPSHAVNASVEIPTDEIEITFIPTNKKQNISCDEYTCSYTVDRK